jgi:hypothetical protein
MVGILMISCVLLEEKLGGEDPELVFYIVPELEVNIGGYYLLPLNTNNTNITNPPVYAYVGYKDFENFDFIDSEGAIVEWYSNLYYSNNDTIGYYRKQYGANETYTYYSIDTTYIFSGDLNKLNSTVEFSSKTDKKGMAKTNVKVLSQMMGDTLVLSAFTIDEYDNCTNDSCWVSMPFIITK